MPTEPLIFKDCNKCVDLSDIVYADIEAILERCEATSTGKLRKHVPCCIGAYWVSKGEVLANGEEYHEFKGKECINSFVDYIDELSTYIYERNKTQTRVPALRKYEDLVKHEAATECIWRKNTFVTDDNLRKNVFDYNHLTGKYRGAAC